jgi:hypothetical protein
MQNWRIERQIFVNGNRQVKFAPNLLATVAVFSIRSGT